MVKALALSGGAARGSFQLGAITALYRVYGFRPDLISGTSVGAINGVVLAQAPPPAVNDAAAILAAAAAGTPDAGLIALGVLEAEWATFLTAADLFSIQPAFTGGLIAGAVGGLGSAAGASAPMSATIGGKVDELTALIATPLVSIAVADAVQRLKAEIMAVLTENAVFNMNPIATRLADPAKLNPTRLAAGTPLYLATVGLESGRLRYVDGTGTFTERDGVTPVLSAVMASDVDVARDENLQPLAADRAARIKDLVARYRAAVTGIASGRAQFRATTTTDQQRVTLQRDLARHRERAEYLLGALTNMLRGVRLRTTVAPARAVLASASLPVLADPIVIGAERYIDGGLREIIPMEVVARANVTELIGICCSTLALPAVDEMSNAGLAAVGLRALTEIALEEVTRDDIAAARRAGIATTIVAPTLNVHGGTEVDPSLIEISSDYGWMRACDELHPAADADREEFRRLSDAITLLRTRSAGLEEYIRANDWFLRAADTREPVATVRTLRWMVRELLARRTALGLPRHPQADRWWQGWARNHRPVGPFGTTSLWSTLAATSTNGVEVRVADAVADPNRHAPDAGSLVDAGNDRVHWIVRGAVFPARTETETSTTRTPVLITPHITVVDLPRVPEGSHLLAEQDTPGEVWIVRNRRRYRATPSLVAASGLAGQGVALVPPDGLDQIISGGAPYWLGGLYVADSAGTPLDRWEPTPQVEGRVTTTMIGLRNRTAAPVRVDALAVSTDQDPAGGRIFTIADPLPLTVAAGAFTWVNVRLQPTRSGPVSGTIAVTCTDPTLPQFEVPVATSVTPLGSHGTLQVTPAGVDLGVIRAGQPAATDVTLTNTGSRALSLVDLRITDESPPGQFLLPFSRPGGLAAGQSTTLHVTCTPTVRGRVTATLVADASSATDTTHPFEQRVTIGLGATAQAPVVFLADRPIAPVLVRGGGRPLPMPTIPRPERLPRLEVELTRLDFGAPAPGTDARRTFWVRNVGDAPLTVTSIDSHWASPFGIPDLSILPATVAPGGELAIEANFLATPQPGRPSSGQLWIQTDDPLRPRVELVVVGRAAGAHLATQPDEGFPLTGVPPTGPLVLHADGTEPVTLRSITVSDPSFVVSGAPALPTTLAPGTTIQMAVTCTATDPGQHNATLVLGHDASASRETWLFLRAEVT